MNQQCRFYQKGPSHCRNGNKCKYSHTQAGESPSSSTSAPSPRNRPSESPNLPSLPPGVCSFYWKSGRCKQEFECKFKHIRCDDGPESTPQRPKFNLAGNDAIAPFLTEQGLAKINGIATDGFFEVASLSPTDAHSRFKRFLLDTFRFKSSFEVYSFLTPLTSASCHNPLWVCISLNSSTMSCYLFRISRKKKGR